ncbi:MAG: F0F1 ATP synthase subunit gamma [Desulfovibrionales bacterium]
MSTLQGIQKKLKTAGDLLSVVKTMKSLASVNIRHYERAVESLEEYNTVMEMAWRVFFLSTGGMPTREATGPALLLTIGTDQGMCGQFNEVVVDLVRKQDERLASEIVHWSAGERITAALHDTGREIAQQFQLPGSLTGVDIRVKEIVSRIEQWQRERGIQQFYLIHNKTGKRGGYRPVLYKVLPLDRNWAEQYVKKEWPRKNLPQMGAPADVFFSHLFSQYLYISLFRAFGQSLAGENAARLASMQSAEKNIGEMLEKLTARYQQQRQNEITSELFDIVSGVEAMTGTASEYER